MECQCGRKTWVSDTREMDGYRRRRYICSCGRRFSTIEVKTVLPGKDLLSVLDNGSVISLSQDQEKALMEIKNAFGL